MRFIIVFLVIVAFALPFSSTDSVAGGSDSDDIRELKRQIERIRQENLRQIEILQSRIGQLEESNTGFGGGRKDKVEIGYKKGFFIKSQDKKWSMTMNGRLQFRFFTDNFDSAKNKDNEYSFQIRRARLVFKGNAFYPWMKYKIQLAADKGEDMNVKDFLVDAAYYKEASLRVGQYKIPYNTEELTSSSALEFVDRSIVNSEFGLGRDIGLDAHGLVRDMFEWNAGVYNGSGRNAKKNQDNNLLFAARAGFYPFGYFKPKQGDIKNHASPKLRLAAYVAGAPDLDPTVEDGSAFADAVSDVIDGVGGAADVVQFGADAGFKWMGLSSEVEFNVRNISPNDGTLGDVTAWGVRAQVGYVYMSRLGAAFRWAYVDPDTDQSDNSKMEFTPALSYYFSESHRLKLQADYSALIEQDPENDLLDHRFRIQLQYYF